MNNDKTIKSNLNNIISYDIDAIRETIRESLEIIPAGVEQSSSTLPDKYIFLNNEKFYVIKLLSISGESEVYLIGKDEHKYVLKLYYPKFKPKQEILDKLKTTKHPHILALIDYGYYKGRFFEISEYAEGGSLLCSVPIKEINILKKIINQIIEALNYCHIKGIIHRDIKPQNIFYRTSERSEIAIGDFGISSVLEDGFSKVLSVQARTTIYAAPEIFQSIGGKTVIGKEIDYYSLGITLIHLWTGKTPFEELGDYGIMRIKIDGRVPIPDDMPPELKDLIRGLTIVEPSKRWGYEQIHKWLIGEKVEVYQRSIRAEYKEFYFGIADGETIIISSPEDMADMMEKYPEIGKKHLYKKSISKWIEQVNLGLYSILESIVEDEYPNDQNAGLIKAIYILDQNRPFRGIDGNFYATREEIADHLEKNFEFYKNDLLNFNSPFYLFLEARGYKSLADKFRSLFKTFPPQAALNMIVLFLQDNVLKINGYKISRPEDLLYIDEETQLKILHYLPDETSKVSLWFYSQDSFNERVINILLSEEEKLDLLQFALFNFYDKHLDIYQVLEKAIFILEKSESPKFLNIIKNALIEYFKYQHNKGFYVNSILQSFLNFIKNNKDKAPRFFKQFSFLIDESFFAPIKSSLNDIKNNEKIVRDFLRVYFDSIETLLKINSKMPYAKIYEKERSIYEHEIIEIKQNLKKEKNNKLNIIKNEYAKLLDERKVVIEKKYDFRYAFVSLIYFLFILIANPMYGNEEQTTFHTIIFVILAIMIWAPFSYGSVFGFANWAILLIFGFIIEKLYKKGIEPEICFLFISLFFACIQIFRLIKRKKLLKSVKLTPEEEKELIKSLDEIENYYLDKEELEVSKVIIKALLSNFN